MRMWMCEPKIMCRQHLIGEYRELFTFIGTLKRKKKVGGYFKNNLFEPLALQSRYEALRDEMIRRGFKPRAKFEIPEGMFDYLGDDVNNVVDKPRSLNDLITRCEECRSLYHGIVLKEQPLNKVSQNI